MVGHAEQKVDDGVNSWDWGGKKRVKMAEIRTGSRKLAHSSYGQAELSQKPRHPRRLSVE